MPVSSGKHRKTINEAYRPSLNETIGEGVPFVLVDPPEDFNEQFVFVYLDDTIDKYRCRVCKLNKICEHADSLHTPLCSKFNRTDGKDGYFTYPSEWYEIEKARKNPNYINESLNIITK